MDKKSINIVSKLFLMILCAALSTVITYGQGQCGGAKPCNNSSSAGGSAKAVTKKSTTTTTTSAKTKTKVTPKSSAVSQSRQAKKVPVKPTEETEQVVNRTVSKTVSGGVLNGRAINLVRPSYPPAAKAVHASGAVNVQVTIDEAGNVIAASAVSGHPLLRAAAEKSALESTFSPTMLAGEAVKVTGVIVYNFVP